MFRLRHVVGFTWQVDLGRDSLDAVVGLALRRKGWAYRPHEVAVLVWFSPPCETYAVAALDGAPPAPQTSLLRTQM